MGTNPTVIADWYKKFKLTAIACGVTTPGQVWSGDETGVQTVPKEKKVLAVRNKIAYQQVSPEKGENSTILTFVSGAGDVVPQMVIHKGDRARESWSWKAPGNVWVAATMKSYRLISYPSFYGCSFLLTHDLNVNIFIGVVNLHCHCIRFFLNFYQHRTCLSCLSWLVLFWSFFLLLLNCLLLLQL